MFQYSSLFTLSFEIHLKTSVKKILCNFKSHNTFRFLSYKKNIKELKKF